MASISGSTLLSYSSDISSAVAQEIDRLRGSCPLYSQYCSEWDFYLKAYEGGSVFANKDNLHKHTREHQEDFDERCKRIHYLNYCAPVVDFFTDFIFNDTIQRDGGANSAWYNTFVHNVNRKGDDVTKFMRNVSEENDIFGMVYVLVDSPRITEGKLTRAEEQKRGIRPYWVLMRPTEVLDWVIDEFDNFQYLKRRQVIDTFIGSERKSIEKYTEWWPDRIVINRVDVTENQKPALLAPEVLTNTIGRVPIVPFRYRRSKIDPFMGVSFLRDIAANNKEIMNLTSLLQEFLYRQCFNILAIQSDSTLPFQDQQDGDVGTSNAITYPKGAEAPRYIVPGPEPADKIQEERQRLITEIYRRAAQDTGNDLFNGGKASGFSKAQSFSKTVPQIAARADNLEAGENRLMELTMNFLGKSWDGKIKYKDHYEVTNVTDAITQLTMLFRDLQVRSDDLVKTELKRMVHEIDGKLSPDLLAKVDAQIDAMDMKEFYETQKQALVGNPKSPAEQQKSKQSGTTMAELQAESEKNSSANATKRLRKNKNKN
jgi:hypothetical protein